MVLLGLTALSADSSVNYVIHSLSSTIKALTVLFVNSPMSVFVVCILHIDSPL